MPRHDAPDQPKAPDMRSTPDARLWTASRRASGALVVALFPFIFILDAMVAWKLSPVLPGLAILVVLIIVLPMGIYEVWRRRLRQADLAEKRSLKAGQWAKGALSVAFVWFALWLAWGI